MTQALSLTSLTLTKMGASVTMSSSGV